MKRHDREAGRPPRGAPHPDRLDVGDAGQRPVVRDRWRGSVGGYAVGAESNVYAGERRQLPAQAGGASASRCTTRRTARRAVDNSQIGVYFYGDDRRS